MKYAIFKDVVTVQGHGAVLLLQVGSTALCVGDSGRSNEGAILEIRLFAPLAEKRFTVKWRGLTQRVPDGAICPRCKRPVSNAGHRYACILHGTPRR